MGPHWPGAGCTASPPAVAHAASALKSSDLGVQLTADEAQTHALHSAGWGIRSPFQV